MGVRVTVVGCAPAYTRQPGNASSCYLVEHDGHAVCLDLGQGSFAALSGYRDPASLEAVVVSHLHPDHHIDLVPMRHYLAFDDDEGHAIALHAPPGLRARIDALHGDTGFLDELPGGELERGVRSVGPFQIEARPVTHAEPSFAFRVSIAGSADGPGLVYSGDCGRPEDLVPLVRAGDTLLCEASWGAEAKPPVDDLHLTARQAGWAAAEGSAGRLVLTHVMERYGVDGSVAAAQEVFRGEVTLARPGMVVAFD